MKTKLAVFETNNIEVVNPKTESHTQIIICPNCGKKCIAKVEHTFPFWSYVHECDCGYWITESEWELAEEKHNIYK
jgi:predicted RNA-binding Zn-ribbon protein involved in translation (DUF1610 family)